MTKPKADEPKTSDPREEARARAAACGAEVEKVLEKHRCKILPFITNPEPVGVDGSRVIIGASYGIFPE